MIEDEIPQIQDDRFHIDNEDKANWYLRKLRHLDDDIKEVKENARLIINSLESQKSGLAYRFQAEFENFIKNDITKGKSKRYLFGLAGVRTIRESVKVLDEDEALLWCKDHAANLIKTKEVLDKSSLDQVAFAWAHENGEVIPGIQVTPAHEQFYPSPKIKETQDEPDISEV